MGCRWCYSFYCYRKSRWTFIITDIKFDVAVVTLSTKNNVKVLKQLQSDLKRIIKWNKYQSNEKKAQNQCLDYLIDPSSQGVNRLSVLSSSDNAHRTSHELYFLPTVEIKVQHVMIDGKNLFDQAVKNDVRTCDNNEKIVTGQVDDCTTGCLLDYVYLKKCP